MKTPLAILHNAADEQQGSGPFEAMVREQVERMDGIVQHQLRRAAASGHRTLGKALEVAPMVERLTRSLGKVYKEKEMQFDLELEPESRFFGDEADLMEVLGNVLENASKYGRSRVAVRAVSVPEARALRPGLEFRIGDDGPGIAPERAQEVLQRGRRMDQSVPGQGLGLSVAAEIVAVYDGRIEIGRSGLGGAEIVIRFPSG
jgi:two-component system sensor histidine kinase PhoQ